MWLPRIIPCLLLDGNGLVKTRRFKESTYVGDPINAIKIFNDKCVDELIFLDISASKARREPDYRLIEKLATECFMPVCYGGGITTAEQARRIVGLGIEKISINASSVRCAHLITEIAAELGSSSVVAGVDVRKTWLGRSKVFDHTKRRTLNIDPLAQVTKLVMAGAGEILLNNVDTDGMQAGYDIDLIRSISSNVNVPIIACGGAGSLTDMKNVIEAGGASAAAAGSLFVFKGPHRAVLISYPSQEQISKLLVNT